VEQTKNKLTEELKKICIFVT